MRASRQGGHSSEPFAGLCRSLPDPAVQVVGVGRLARAVEGADVVVHLVAHMVGTTRWRLDAGDTHAEKVNSGLMGDLVGALADGAREGPPPVVLFAGTVSQVGLAARSRIDGTEPDAPQGAHDRQKLAAEWMLKRATAQGVLRGISLRMPTVFGHEPGSFAPDRGVVSTMIRRAPAGERLTLWHDGTVLRDLLHVDDVARAFVAALEGPEGLSGGHWLLGSGQGVHLGEVFTRVADLVSRYTGRPPVPVVSVRPPEKAEVTDFHNYQVDSSAFTALTGWGPRVPVNEGLARTVRTLVEQTGHSRPGLAGGLSR